MHAGSEPFPTHHRLHRVRARTDDVGSPDRIRIGRRRFRSGLRREGLDRLRRPSGHDDLTDVPDALDRAYVRSCLHTSPDDREDMGVFARAKAAKAIDVAPWGKVRQLPNGKMQMFVRDPSGNLIEIASTSTELIDLASFRDDIDIVEPQRGVYRMAPGASTGRHETS